MKSGMQILHFYLVEPRSSGNFFRNIFKVKESSLNEIWNADTAFLLSGAHRSSGNFFRNLFKVKENSLHGI